MLNLIFRVKEWLNALTHKFYLDTVSLFRARAVAGGSFEAKLMHDPLGFPSFGGAALVEHQSFSHADLGTLANHGPIFSCGLPVSRNRGPICS